jgi:GcrA cell cycle regulator
MAWTDERIAALRQYWEEGRSASQIAEVLGEGLSRNAVIGKAHRLGLASRPSPLKTGEAKSGEARSGDAKTGEARPADAKVKAEPRVVRPATARPLAAAPAVASPPGPAAPAAPVAAPAPATPAPVRSQPVRAKGAKVTLLDLNDRICKWPIGHPDEADFHFCGKPVNAGFPYCGEHCLVAYQAQMPRRDRPGGPSRPFGPNLPRPR